jgi:hypothetical protein
MQNTNHTPAAQGQQQHKRLPSHLFVAIFFLMPLVGWGQSLPFVVTTPDDVINHNEKFYWIESAGATGFYAVPHSNNTNASTTNAPTLRALWYFMESGESGYYYIINKETGKYLKKTGDVGVDNTIGVATYASADDDKFKFSFDTPQGITEGSWVVYPKEAGTEGWLSKKSGNIQYGLWLKVSNWNSTPVGDLNSQWKIVARADVQWPKSGLPFVVSTSSDKHYYRINHAQNTSFNISYDGSNFATISNAYDNKTAWYFEEAASDPDINNLKYYYIVNASSEKYLKFTATTINGSNQNDKFILSDYVAGDEDRFQFVVVNSFGGNAGYSIMPKLAMSKFGDSDRANSMVPASVANNEKLDLRSDRNNNNAHWNFLTTEYPMSCAVTSITYSNSTGKITISSTPADADIHYTTDGTEPSSSVGELYSEPFDVSSAVTIKAIATKTGYNDSEVATVSFDQVATPTIQNNGSNAISITCATEGATIYYTTDGTTPTTASTPYTGPLTENVSGVTINAIAVKEGLINSAVGTGSVTLKCAKPVIIRSGDPGNYSVTISCAFPANGITIYYTINGDDPTISSSEYTGSIQVDLGDVIKAIATASGYDNSDVATKTIHQDLTPDGEGNYHITNQTDFETFVDMASEEAGASYHYVLDADVTAVAEIAEPFTGIFDGNYHTITGLSEPFFNTVDGGVVKNVMLKEVDISSSADTVGAITNIAKGYSRIYNCGILPNNANFPEGTHPSVSTTGNCAGGLVGSLRDDSRVVNCFSYADVSSAGYAAGIVGNNTFASTAEVEDVSGTNKYTHLRTMVVNCIFYGNISASTIYPVYGGQKISNKGANAINNYNFYSVGCTFSPALTDYNCSWPAQLEYLTRYEFHRNLLNSNRELCGWWVGAPNAPSTMDTTDVRAVPKDASLMAKWVLDRDVAPYPILKPFGKYSSPVNIDADASWRETANKWEGKKLGTLSVTINPGSHAASGITTTSPTDFVITDMDTIHGDYCYKKIQLPYYNTVFGDPNGETWAAKYGGNYGDYVVIGWKVSASGGTTGELVEDWQDGYNFADRNCTAKDANRVFAQGGYYYVPNGVSAITITAQWAQAVYFDNTDHSYDRVYMSGSQPGTPFAPAGTRPTKLGNGKTVLTNNVRELATTDAYIGDNIYEYAVVLVGNHQYRHNTGSAGENIGNTNSTKGFTVMSSDFDFDEEPDHCLIWQLGYKYGRQAFCPIRFDFLPIEEIGLAMKEDGSTQYYSLGCYRPLGHFEVTETSLIHFGQFEFSNKNRTVYAPLILNGGIYDQYTKGTNNNAFSVADDKINYIIIGGNVRIPSFTPGAHVNGASNFPTRHCAVNVIGGSIDNLYLTGNYNENVTPNVDDPHCYIDGGRIKHVAAAGKEGINGDVYFKINHAKIWEFYGGSTMDQSSGVTFKTVKGNIDVTIDSSIVVKYCGGPKFGDMVYDEANPANSKTITTNANNTTFGVYYGGGNGGTSYVQYDKTDVTGDYGVSTGTYNWNGTGNNQGHLDNYNPGDYRSGDNNYMADYDMEIVNTSAGTESGEAVCRTYFYAAQFSATNTGPISNNLTGCEVLKNFYGAGNLGGVFGDVTSVLIDTKVDSLAFGAGFSASIPQVTIYNKNKTAPTIDIHTGIITPQSGGTSTTYTWCYKNTTTGVVVPEGVTIPEGVGTGNPAFTSGGKNYFYTTVSLEGLGTVRGNVTLTLKGNSEVGTQGHADTGNVFGGGDESAVAKNASNQKGNTSVNLQQGTIVRGSVYGGGNRGTVGGNSSVTIQDTPTP